MNLTLSKSVLKPLSPLNITGSKSESNRLLLLQALFSNISIQNLSNSDDTKVMQKALSFTSNDIDVHHAGTAMRFLLAYFATQEDISIVLTGSQRMKERPIKILVEALRALGADISYLEKEGFPPLAIKGKKIVKNKVSLEANVSSQYISALLLIAPSLHHGLELQLNGNITSLPYIKMTISLLEQLGAKVHFNLNTIKVEPLNNKEVSAKFVVESDWSSASYYYSFVALSKIKTEIRLSAYRKESLQGDSMLVDIYRNFGVATYFEENIIILRKESENYTDLLELDLINAPDIAQTIAVTAFGLGLECKLTGLHTLKIKETDRLSALKIEIEKLGGQLDITDSSLHLRATPAIKDNKAINTYNDHRMAMAFAPLSLKTSLQINDAMVVNKSYPGFWEDIKSIGVNVK